MEDTRTKKRHQSRSRAVSNHKAAKKTSSSRHRDSSSSSPERRHKSLAKYHADTSRKEKRKKRKRKSSRSSSSSSSESKRRRKKKARSSSESSSTSSSSSSSTEHSSDHLKHRSHHKKKSKLKKGKKKKLKKKSTTDLKKNITKVKGQEVFCRTEESHPGPSLDLWKKEPLEDTGPVLTDEQKTRIQAMKPMTKEEWDARQSVIRKVLDPETGRMRLIKGDGEVLEEIVSKDRHKEINKQATASDGFTFQMTSGMF
ncbi:ADP-ribosylation factor-like protein 6-interacting protein 4 isoform X2 [Pseudophryne corroboree]|uniref:ADP-ribosylation factor-like protein 6-interacting protein 4 isoform X2 n=1 Tax=Pseudophryne corroboree TaxID=495146 RepID=UPI003081E4B5